MKTSWNIMFAISKYGLEKLYLILDQCLQFQVYSYLYVHKRSSLPPRKNIFWITKTHSFFHQNKVIEDFEEIFTDFYTLPNWYKIFTEYISICAIIMKPVINTDFLVKFMNIYLALIKKNKVRNFVDFNSEQDYIRLKIISIWECLLFIKTQICLS